MTRVRQHRRTRRLPEPAWRALENGDARAWNRWRQQEPDDRVDLRGLKTHEPRPGAWLRSFNLRGADLRGVRFAGAELSHADLRGARLDGANLNQARLIEADCREINFGEASLDRANLKRANLAGCRGKAHCSFFQARLEKADLSGATLPHANFDRADLSGATLVEADLRGSSFTGADLSEADLYRCVLRSAQLDRAVLYRTRLEHADLRWASVADAFVREIRIDQETKQDRLTGKVQAWFTREGFDAEFVCVNDLRAASLLSLLGDRGAIASLINAGSKSVVLILGRFQRRRKAVLTRLKNVLQTKGKIPILFDFPGPVDRELSDTVRVLATLSEFIVVDLSSPRSVPLELQAIVPGLMIPVVPIVEANKPVFAMFQDLQRRYFWVLPPVSYTDKEDLAEHVGAGILRRVRKVQRQIERRRKELIEAPATVDSFGPPEAISSRIDMVE